ncbi:MAG: GNAT family N-acetyltransferase [Myxococcaceae bacterium]|nr:GNAT family N-acetyltransferase [Myxococcaceae bacterium]MCI0671722.1 GNAT family N-acetyltransferase [Myxococcaceae bacterium]
MRLRPLIPDDVPACLALAAAREWPAEALKWRMLLSIGEGFALEAPEGGLAGAVISTPYGGRAGVIGMMLIAPAHEGRGLARRLMERALERLGPVPTLLYATPQGRPLDEKLGFVEVDTLHKHVGTVRALAGAFEERDFQVRVMMPADLEAVVALDAVSFGAPRRMLLQALAEVSLRSRVAVRENRIVGYGLSWPNLDVVMVGPLVAPDDTVAQALASELVRGQQGLVRLDIPSRFIELSAWAATHGLVKSPPAPLMVLHADMAPGLREHLYAVAMQAVG